MTEEKKKPFYGRGWFVVLVLLLFYPIGVVLLWAATDWGKKSRWVLTVILGLLFLIRIGGETEEAEIQEDDTNASEEVSVESGKGDEVESEEGEETEVDPKEEEVEETSKEEEVESKEEEVIKNIIYEEIPEEDVEQIIVNEFSEGYFVNVRYEGMQG